MRRPNKRHCEKQSPSEVTRWWMVSLLTPRQCSPLFLSSCLFMLRNPHSQYSFLISWAQRGLPIAMYDVVYIYLLYLCTRKASDGAKVEGEMKEDGYCFRLSRRRNALANLTRGNLWSVRPDSWVVSCDRCRCFPPSAFRLNFFSSQNSTTSNP